MRWPQGAGVLGLALLLLASSGVAQTLRVTSWSLQPTAVGTNVAAAHTNGIRIAAAAAALKRLNPDVILLQQVADWAMCQELADALKPLKYNVVTCSAFREARGAARKQQVAILAKPKAKAYVSWSETWRNHGVPPVPGGFAFAALQVGQHRVGLFSVEAAAPGTGPASRQRMSPAKQPGPHSPEERLAATVEQLLRQVGSVSEWSANRVQAIVLGGTFGLPAGQTVALHDEPLRLLQEAGFGDAFGDAAPAERGTVRGRPKPRPPVADYIFTQPAECTTNPSVLRAQVCRHFPVTCDMQLGLLTAALPPVKVPVILPPPVQTSNVQAELPALPEDAAAALPEAHPGSPKAPAQTATASQESKLNQQLFWIIAANAGLLAVATTALFLLWRKKPRRPRGPALLTAGDDVPSGYTVVMARDSATESASPGPRATASPQQVIHIEAPGLTHTEAEALRQRALAAERQAERAQAIIRAGLIPDLRSWLKQKLAHKLMTDRARLLEAQQTATRQAEAVERRLARIEQQVQEQNQRYADRIEELTRELVVAKEENRELIRARIEQVKAEMAAARERLLAQEQAALPQAPGQDI